MTNPVLYQNLEKGPISEPFLHSTYQLFDTDTCSKLIENIKELKEILSKDKKLSQSRMKINLEGDTKNGFGSHKYLEQIRQLEPLNTVMKEYEKNIPESLYKKYNDTSKDKIRFCLMIVYDVKNYEIGPHTDSPVRNATMVSFLGPPTNIKLGTKIYIDEINRHKNPKNWQKKHYSFDNFKEVKQVEYFPGSTIDFKVSTQSFHGVPKINESCDRFSLQYYIYND